MLEQPTSSYKLAEVTGVKIANPTSSQRMQFHTFVADGVVPRNYRDKRKAETAQLGSIDQPKLTEDPEGWDGHGLTWWDPQGAPTTAMIVAQVNLTRTPSLAGHSVFFAVDVRLPADNSTTLELLIDDGSGTWVASDPPGVRPTGVLAVPAGVWHVASFQRVLLPSGLAQFAIRVTVATNHHESESVQLGKVAVAVIGAGWDRLV